MGKKVFSVIFIGILSLPGFQTRAQSNFINDSLDVYVVSAMQEWKIPGVAIAVVKNGKVLVMKGYGVLEKGGKERVDENTRFGIGSNTKAFTATSLAMLQSEKKLSLDDKVQKWVPDFKLKDPWVSKETTIRDLLCHRLGFETFQGDFMYFDSDLSYPEVKEKFGKVKPLYSFRSKWGYTNAAFAVAGEVIEKVSGTSWGNFLQQNIFTPLGMTRTMPYSIQLDTASNTAKAHTLVDGQLRKIPYGHIDNLAPAGSISSSAHDMANWAMALLKNGEWDGKKIIPSEAITATRTPQSILGDGGHPFNKSHFSLYGLGWFLTDYEGRKLVEHTGGVNGFVTSFTLVPEEQVGIVVLTNTDANGFYEAMKWELLDASLGLPYRNYNQLALDQNKIENARINGIQKSRRDTVAMKLPMTFPVTQIIGNYVHEVYGKMTIADEKGKLVARFEHHKGRYAVLEPMKDNRFLASFNDPLYGVRVWPFRVENGKIKSVTVNVNGFVEFTTYEFYKK
ncbi:serine hydrolase [Flavihumibacter profundi]|uniref:serine hydrolase n=1 Tax=Flavihumibacter profundi TaxID=2716883 RepID=UPI001CC72D05|nr:serine hydrolase [Flavihumibacter profundi]MBZ5858987.1 serine hydrolase [Flavihumibacter profundi]